MAQIIVQLSPLWGQRSETEAPWSLPWDKTAHECGEQARASTVQHGSRSSTAASPASPCSSWPEFISVTRERRCIRCQEDCPSDCHPWLIVVRDFKRNRSRHQKDFLIFFLISVSFSEIHLFQIRQHSPSHWFRPFLYFNVIVGNQLGHFKFYFLWDFETWIPINLLNNKSWQTMGQRENSGACLGKVLPAHSHNPSVQGLPTADLCFE